jgi:non-specific serine/threonine protein kinase
MSPSSLLLRAQPTSIVGRVGELETIHRRLLADGVRLLTLIGPAGVGKTRLALAAAAQVADHFPDGVVLVDLTPIRDPPLVLCTMAHVLGLADTLPEQFQASLRERKMLLILDNFEQVLPAAAALADLLAGCPGLTLLVTSRVPLHLRWEQVLRVPPLPVPDLSRALPPLDELARVPAVALFVERAQAQWADFTLTEAQAPLVARLAVKLDGLPLALELAAARLGALPLSAIASRLEDRLQLLRWEAPDLPERQRSLHAAVRWSYDLLSDDERLLLRCLGVFVGRVALDAIAATVAGESDEGCILDGMASLAEKSLIMPAQQNVEDDPEPVFGMLETVREFAWEQLDRQGELAAARQAHAHYFLALAERADPQLRGPDQRAWFLRLEREQDNLRAALRWLLEQDAPAEREGALRLAGALAWFWWLRGYHAEGLRWLEEALRRVPEAGAAVRTQSLLGVGRILMQRSDYERSQAVLEEALALAQRRQDPAAIAEALTHLGACAVYARDWAKGARLLREALARCEGLGDHYWSGTALYLLGAAALAQGHDAEAAALEAEALDRLEAVGDARVAGTAHFGLAVIMCALGDQLCAARHVRAGLRISVALQDHWLLSIGARATLLLVGDRTDPARRARLLGAADALRQATGATAMWERVVPDQDVATLRELIEREGWGAAYREGRRLPFEAVAALALSMVEDFKKTLAHPDSPETMPEKAQPPPTQESPLSAREQEVLRRVAQGLSSKAVGRQLFISASTVNQHLTSIFHKLGVITRAQAVAVAVQQGLL